MFCETAVQKISNDWTRYAFYHPFHKRWTTARALFWPNPNLSIVPSIITCRITDLFLLQSTPKKILVTTVQNYPGRQSGEADLQWRSVSQPPVSAWGFETLNDLGSSWASAGLFVDYSKNWQKVSTQLFFYNHPGVDQFLSDTNF